MGLLDYLMLFMTILSGIGIGIGIGNPPQVLPKCPERCGDLTIPYPFGTKKGCYLNEDYFIRCREDNLAYLGNSEIRVTDISTINNELTTLQSVVWTCGGGLYSKVFYEDLEFFDFEISNTKNIFTVTGCSHYAYLKGLLKVENERKPVPFITGCMALCNSTYTLQNGSCSGGGCCQLEIPEGLTNVSVQVHSFPKFNSISTFNNCGNAFLVEKSKFSFSINNVIDNISLNKKVPLVLDWSIMNYTCKEKSCSICGGNSTIGFLEGGYRYNCACLDGFEGNPYAIGCQDIDECKDKNVHICKNGCINTIGNYTCPCPKGFIGDDRYGGEGCTPKQSFILQTVVGIGVGFIALLIGSLWIYLWYRRWKFIKLKHKFFEQNGGLMLQQHLLRWQGQGTSDMAKIFSQTQLKKATNNFDEAAIAGKGGFGTVYKGVLEDGLIVAIKKSKLVDQSQIEQFINEVIILSQINHRNVVKLLGCCLETEVPLLVYEFINNGTLFDHIHNNKIDSLSWEIRLKIASETAGVLSYLHSSASTPIIHRDIKPTNILLDENYTAKVSDFGASKLVPIDQTQLSTMVQGTLGYLDPEYLLTSELTEKSDVYSFGIVLVELITGKKAISFEGPEAERNLAKNFLSAMKRDSLEVVVEKDMVKSENFKHIKEVANLAKMCLKVKGDERPTMKEVATELEGLRMMVENLSIRSKSRSEESEYLINTTVEGNEFFEVDLNDSMKSHVGFQFHTRDGR